MAGSGFTPSFPGITPSGLASPFRHVWGLFGDFRRPLISKSFGCFLFHPVYGVDIAAACKK
jgi:hypothetical protein